MFVSREFNEANGLNRSSLTAWTTQELNGRAGSTWRASLHSKDTSKQYQKVRHREVADLAAAWPELGKPHTGR